jgi:hypothetical protein
LEKLTQAGWEAYERGESWYTVRLRRSAPSSRRS